MGEFGISTGSRRDLSQKLPNVRIVLETAEPGRIRLVEIGGLVGSDAQNLQQTFANLSVKPLLMRGSGNGPTLSRTCGN